MGALYEEQAQFAQAEPLYERALAIREKEAKNNPIELSTTLYSLGMLYRKQNRHAEAIKLEDRAESILAKLPSQ